MKNMGRTIKVNPLDGPIDPANAGLSRFGNYLTSAALVCALSLNAMASTQSSRGRQFSNHGEKLFQPARRAVCIEPLETTQEATKQPQKDVAAQPVKTDQVEQMRKTIHELTTELERFRKKVGDLEKDRAIDTIQDRLTKQEQRAETLQAQLLGIAEKEASLQSHMDQLTEQLRPENIDKLQVGGSLHPDEVREATRRGLSNEKHRIQAQLDLLHHSHVRLEASIAESDTAIRRLRSKLN
jgi:small-conductance mechanosensitive channel